MKSRFTVLTACLAGWLGATAGWGAVPGMLTLQVPNGTTTVAVIRFDWQGGGYAPWYQIWIARNGSKYLDRWVEYSRWIPDHDLAAGDYSWWVRGWNPEGYGPWSAEAQFTKLKGSVSGYSPDKYGVCGIARTNYGLYGYANEQAILGESFNSTAIRAISGGHYGLYATANASYGVFAWANGNYGIYAHADGKWGGYFTSGSNDAVYCGGNLVLKNGSSINYASGAYKAFEIDHPLQPADKVLRHFCSEGPEALVIYRGKGILDESGRAEVRLPDYFCALARDPLVHLTPVGNRSLYLEAEVSGNTFMVGGDPGTKFTWLVTAERNDPRAQLERARRPVEQDKGQPGTPPAGEYISPECYPAP